ncbi:MAG: hypothetical protein M8353_05315 [ANME-2 cluster archaeon]|nr:hypothetical protein [ANME-2 cluster archaeon]
MKINDISLNISPESNLSCNYRLSCGAHVCPEKIYLTKKPDCRIEKYERYQPVWYDKNWHELNSITWYDVFSLKESWMYLLIIIVIALFLFFSAILISVYAGISLHPVPV